jgi:hypothetical protein
LIDPVRYPSNRITFPFSIRHAHCPKSSDNNCGRVGLLFLKSPTYHVGIVSCSIVYNRQWANVSSSIYFYGYHPYPVHVNRLEWFDSLPLWPGDHYVTCTLANALNGAEQKLVDAEPTQEAQQTLRLKLIRQTNFRIVGIVSS